MSAARIAVAPGDGVGPEVTTEAVRVLRAIAELNHHTFEFFEEPVGGNCIDAHGVALMPGSLRRIRGADALLFGAVGGPKWDDPRASVRPEDGLLALRKGLKVFANLRPVKIYPALLSGSPLKSPNLADVDFMVVRELTGGLYFAKPKKVWDSPSGRRAVDTCAYSEFEIERVLKVAIDLARGRRKKLTSVDKANVMATGRLWREVAMRLAKENPDIQVEHILADSCAMALITRPESFDVIVTENTFGDILTDEAAVIGGSMGMLPSASLGTGKLGFYEPIHGSAPDIAGKGIANPLAAILSAALLLRYSLDLEQEALLVEQAVDKVIAEGARTPDIARGDPAISTQEMTDAVLTTLRTLHQSTR